MPIFLPDDQDLSQYSTVRRGVDVIAKMIIVLAVLIVFGVIIAAAATWVR